MGSKRQQQNAQAEENKIDGDERQSVGTHVLLRLTEVATGEILLHHVLIKPRHDDDDENTAHELLQEMLWRTPVVKDKQPAVRTFPDGVPHPAEIEVHQTARLYEDEAEGSYEAERLQRIREDDGADAATARVQPDEQLQEADRCEEGHVKLFEHVRLENHADKELFCRRPCHARQEEERCACLVGPASETAVQIGVNGRQFQAVVEWQQHEGDYQIAEEETERHLHVCHVRLPDPARDGDEGNAGDGGSNHPERDEVPPRLAVAAEKGVVVALPRGQPGDCQ